MVLAALAVAAFAGGPALAQSAGAIKLKGKFTTPAPAAAPSPEGGPSASPPDLRGSLGVQAPAAPITDDDGDPLPAPAPSSLPASGRSFAGGLPTGLAGGFAASALPPLPTLAPVGDPAPICRAECSKARVYCAGADDPGCDSQWAQCIATCSAPAAQ